MNVLNYITIRSRDHVQDWLPVCLSACLPYSITHNLREGFASTLDTDQERGGRRVDREIRVNVNASGT